MDGLEAYVTINSIRAMIRSLSIVLLLQFLPAVSPAQDDFFQDLSSDEFQVRDQAQTKLEIWAKERKEAAIEPLLQAYKNAESPEVQSRIAAVLKEQVILKKFGSGPGFVGIRMQDGKVQVNGELQSAVGIIEIVKDSSAEKAGLKVGDNITAVDKVRFQDDNLGRVMPSQVFSNYVRTKTANDVVVLKVVRNNVVMEVKVVLMTMPEKVRIQQMELNMQDTGISQAQKDAYFQKWLLGELKK